MAPQRHRAAAKKPTWIIMLISMVCFILIGTYVYPPRHYSQCYLFGSSVCTPFKDWLPTMGRRERTDEEIISSVVIRDILAMPMLVSRNPKIALMFLTPGSLPFEKFWERFLEVGPDILLVFVLFKKDINLSRFFSFLLTARDYFLSFYVFLSMTIDEYTLTFLNRDMREDIRSMCMHHVKSLFIPVHCLLVEIFTVTR
jgi:hypothetical protein